MATVNPYRQLKGAPAQVKTASAQPAPVEQALPQATRTTMKVASKEHEH